jgi:hypothetical protein
MAQNWVQCLTVMTTNEITGFTKDGVFLGQLSRFLRTTATTEFMSDSY